jgi:hypothetical protein
VDIEVLLYPQAVGDHVSHLELCKSEAFSWLNAAVVFDGWAVVFDGWTPYNRSKPVDRAWSNVSHLELCKSEALSWLSAAVVFEGWTPYNRSKLPLSMILKLMLRGGGKMA